MKSVIDDVAVTCDEVEYTLESAPINLSNRINYCLISLVLLAIPCLLLLGVIVVKYEMKCGLTIPCLLSY